MALMVREVYDALRAANVPDDKAQAAAEAVASNDARVLSVESRVTLLTWMVGTNVALTIAVLARLFFTH